MRQIAKLIADCTEIVDRHRLAPGAYARRLGESDINPYGCADAANIRYTIGVFPTDNKERDAFVSVMRGMQDMETGLFSEPTHHPMHTTAHVTAALELFDAKPLYRFAAYDPYRTREGLCAFLDSLDWKGSPWNMSHRGAGLYAAEKLTGEATPDWEDWYFAWLWDETDPETGFPRKGCAGQVPLFEHMAGAFHYLFDMEHARRPLRYPEKMIDACLDMYARRELLPNFGRMIGFLEIDWVYCLTRARRQCGHRFREVTDALRDFAGGYIPYLQSLDPETDAGLNDLHMLFGAVCALAELQSALPGEIRTDKPLRLVLDRRPFI